MLFFMRLWFAWRAFVCVLRGGSVIYNIEIDKHGIHPKPRKTLLCRISVDKAGGILHPITVKS